MKKLIFIIAMFFATTFAAQSQNTTRPWLFGVSTNFADFHAVEMPVSEQLSDANWMGKTVVSQLKVARLLSKEIVFGAEFSMIKLDMDKLNEWPYIESPINTNNFWRLQGQFEYKFANGYLLKQESRFDPYIFLGVNGSNINKKTYLAQSTGIGFNIWVTDWLGVNAEGSYDYVFQWNDYFHYSMGLVARFGKKSDGDGDGIADKKDACPEVAGLAEFMGCPDTDNDGIPDSEDSCPTEAGLKITNGCPDTDGDGIIDSKDQCPKEPGPDQFAGCPDTDGDGIIDKDDECPLEKGTIATKGCPDTDGDGITDKDDKCPNEAGTLVNNGCPAMKLIALTDSVEIKQVETTLKNYAETVEFATDKYVIKPSSFPKLDSVVYVINQHPNANFIIEGHTDNVGKDAYNQTLSESRAYAMRQYLVDKNVNPDRLTFVGYGESRPRDTNSTAKGRANNRRVEIHVVK